MNAFLSEISWEKYFPISDPTWIFVVVLGIILFAPIIMGKLRIPHIIGMILAGILVGEYGLNILERDSSFELFGKVGLLYIMFLAGLEMDLNDFKKNKVKGLVFGMWTFFIPMILGVVSSMWILHFSLVTSILLASMYASHTLITYPIISRYGLTRKLSVSITISGTAITVFLALSVLAVIAGIYRGTDNSISFWALVVFRIIALCALIIWLMPRLCRWFFRKYDDAVMQFIFVLSMVFLGAGLMELVGMEGILGAFLAGLVLNRYVPYVSPLMNRLEFVGNALFIPYFLIGVGMIIDIRSLFQTEETLKVALVMTLIATFSKWLAAYLTKLNFRLKQSETLLIFGLSNAQAAATLAAVLIGHEIVMPDGSLLLNDDVLNGTVVMILFTCIISSFVTEYAAKKMLTEENEGEGLVLNYKSQSERIMIPIANPETVDGLVELALILKNPKSDKNVVALSVIDDINDTGGKESKAKRNLEKAAVFASASDKELTTVLRYDINRVQGIIHTALEYGITDVLIGLHRKTSIIDSFFGNMTESLLSGTHRQVMIAKLLVPANTLRRIVVAVPEQAELEAGFKKWVIQLSRLSSVLACQIHFNATLQTQKFIKKIVAKEKIDASIVYYELSTWDDLLILTNQMAYDHLFVVIAPRKDSVFYKPSFDRLPSLINKYFANNSLLMIYPDQWTEDGHKMSFTNPRSYAQVSMYDEVNTALNKWINKDDKQ